MIWGLILAIIGHVQYWGPPEYRAIIVAESVANEVPVWLACNLIYAESKFDMDSEAPNLDSEGNVASVDRGPMRLNSKYFPKMSIDANIHYGLKTLREKYLRTGSWPGAVWAYNAGDSSYKKGIMPKLTARTIYNVFKRWYTAEEIRGTL